VYQGPAATAPIGDTSPQLEGGEMTLTAELLPAAVTCAWALGAQRSTLDTGSTV
jgi:hypothetical protein